MSTKRGKGRGQRQQPSTRQRGRRVTEEEREVVPQYVDPENHSRQSYLALQKAFHDMTKKFQLSQDEKLTLQTENSTLHKEIENLKLSVEKGFEAFDDKYKEIEKLKKELYSKEKGNADKGNQSTNDQSTGTAGACPEIKNTHIGQQETQKTSSSTQTDEEKTDKLTVSPTNYKILLEDCGMEIVSQNDKLFLILTNRYNFKCWIENVSDGKVIVDFEKVPVTERLVQTDEVVTQYRYDTRTCDHDRLINMLKSKISDQAYEIKEQRQRLAQMHEVQLALSAQKENNQYQALKRYHKTFISHCREVENQVNLLKAELEHQQKYSKRLVDVIKGSRDLPKQFLLLSEVTHEKLKSQGQREVKEPFSFPVLEEHIEADTEEKSTNGDDDDNSLHGLYSVAVQETENSLSNVVNESSASVVTLPENTSSRSNGKSGLESSRARGFVDSKKSNSFGDIEEVKPVIALRNNNEDQAGATDTENDDFVVLNEETVAAGGAAGISVGAKQCPICYISFTPDHSQKEFEAHVVAHFQD